MAVLFADNFQNYGLSVTPMLNGVYAQVSNAFNVTGTNISLVDDPDPSAPAESRALLFSGSSSTAGPTMRHVFPGGGLGTVGIAFRIWMPALPAGPDVAPVISFRDVSNVSQCQFWVNSDGTISFYRAGGQTSLGGATPTGNGGQGTLLATSSIPVLNANAWNHVEIKVTISDASGASEVRVNGVEVPGLTLSGVDTKGTSNTTTTQVVFAVSIPNGGTNTTSQFYLRDFIEWDTNGSQNNNFLGSLGVYTLRPDSDANTNWATSTGTSRFALVDESTPDDADYISADNTPPAAQQFTVTNLPPDIVSVRALLPFVRARKIDGGDGNLQMGLTGTLTDLGADRPITTAFTYYWDVSELSPDTAAAWTPVEVDAVKLDLDRTV